MLPQEGFKKLPALRQKDELLWALASARLLNLSDAQRRKGPPTKSVMGAFDWEGVVETLLQKVIDARDEAIANAALIVGNLLSLQHAPEDGAHQRGWMEEVSKLCLMALNLQLLCRHTLSSGLQTKVMAPDCVNVLPACVMLHTR